MSSWDWDPIRGRRSRKEIRQARCSFCHRQRDEVSHLLEGPLAFICEPCVRALLQAPESRGLPSEFLSLRCETPENTHLCSFCRGVLRRLEPGSPRPGVDICRDCLSICDQILKENEELRRRRGAEGHARRLA